MKKINKKLLENLTVLYVEDNLMIQEEVVFFLKKYIKNVHYANDGEEGIELFNKVNPDILISDIQMPKINGLEMIEKIEIKNTAIILTTAYSDVKYFLKAIELKINKFIIKPISLIELMETIHDCAVHKEFQNRLFEKENLLKIVDENVLLSITDDKGIIIDASHSFCAFTKYDKDELIGSTHAILKHENTPIRFYENMWKKIKEGKIFTTEIRNRKKDGEEYWAELTITPIFKANEIVNFIAIRQDITNKKTLEELAIKDEMTKLYNRRYFNEILEKEIRRAKRDKTTLSLITIDVDYFKRYNDLYGHPSGDKVLIDIAKVLSDFTSRGGDYSFRMGGEEFSIICSKHSQEEAVEYTNSIIKEIESLKIVHENSKCNDYVTISAGLLVQTGENIESASTLYFHSDNSLYDAKQSGRNKMVLSSFSN